MEPYTEKQIDLIKTFADQAVIAIENARLFDEVQARTLELASSLEELRTAQDAPDVLAPPPVPLAAKIRNLAERRILASPSLSKMLFPTSMIAKDCRLLMVTLPAWTHIDTQPDYQAPALWLCDLSTG